ncbi:hypothetical protein L6R29_07665 [Myxococcota bacterium]|nr:hypothetical protein [Myxococcota bacterium]
MFELLFKTHFWSFKLLFVLSSSYFLAATVSQAVRASLPPAIPYIVVSDGPMESPLQKKTAQFAVLNQANLFDPNQAPLQPPPPRQEPDKMKEKPNDPKTATCPAGGYRESKTLPLELKGTVAATDPTLSVAALYDAIDRQVIVVRTDEVYKGIRICKIEPRFLKVDRGSGRLEFIEIGKKAGQLGNNYQDNYYNTYRKLRDTDFDTSKVRQVENGRYQIPRDFISKVTERLDLLASKAAIVPFFEKGQPVGFRIYSIRPGSLYEKIGIKNDDVIRQINGYQFNSPQKALEAYSNLMSASSLNVSVQRGGKVVDMRYEIKE